MQNLRGPHQWQSGRWISLGFGCSGSSLAHCDLRNGGPGAASALLRILAEAKGGGRQSLNELNPLSNVDSNLTAEKGQADISGSLPEGLTWPNALGLVYTPGRIEPLFLEWWDAKWKCNCRMNCWSWIWQVLFSELNCAQWASFW